MAAAAALVSWQAATAAAAFDSGVELFPGTVKDLSTWGQTDATALIQSDGLMYDTQGIHGTVSFNTRTQTVAWGQSVRMTVTNTTDIAGVSLFLTNNSAGPNALGSNNSAFWSFDLNTNTEAAFDRVIMGTGSSGAWGDGNRGIFTYKPLVNHKYVLQLTPLSLNSAKFTLFDSDGLTVLESHLYDNAPINVPDLTHISIQFAGGGATVHSVAIVPEPTAAATTCSIVLALVGHRRRSRRISGCRRTTCTLC
jgi:hypothetical protein